MRGIKVGALTVAVGALTVAAAACATPDRAEPSSASHVSSAPVGDKVVLGEGRDRTASQTADDWVTYADHVLVVTVLNETRLSPSRKEASRGEGMAGGNVKLRVDKVLWSAPDAPQPAPAILDLSAAGWVFNNNSTGEAKFALRHASRLEKGHTYVKAVEWIKDPCSDNPKQGSWEALGSGDTIPFDAGVLGAGEFEGRVQTLDESKAKWRVSGATRGVRAQMTGESVDTLVTNLKAASPRPERGYVPTECDPSDR